MIGSAVDRDTMDLLKQVDPRPQIQTYRLQWALIRAIEAARSSPIEIISTVPTRDFPFTGKAWWGFRRGVTDDNPHRGVLIMPFVNVLGLKQITRFLSCLVFTLAWLAKFRRRRDKVLLLYGLIVSHLHVSLLLGRLFGAKVIAVVTDPPTLRQADEGIPYALARWIDGSLLRLGMRQLDGLIPLTEPLARSFAPGVPFFVLEGIISDDVVCHASAALSPAISRGPDGRFIIMYAGALNEVYGVEILLDAFRRLQGDRYALWLFGRGRLEGKIAESARADARITYWGFVDDDVLFARMREASVLVSPRPPDPRLTPYLFPSKILEYLAMGKVVVSAKLDGIPADYWPRLVLVDPMNGESLAETLGRVAGWNNAELVERERAGREFVWQHKTQLHQGIRAWRFLLDVAHGRRKR